MGLNKIFSLRKSVALCVISGLLTSCANCLNTTRMQDDEVRLIGLAPVKGILKEANIGSFDIYAVDNRLYLAYTDKSKNAKFPEVYYQFSKNNGVDWSEPREIGKQFGMPVESNAGNDIQIAASGDRILVVLQTTGELPGMGPLVPIFSSDAGNNWQKGENPTENQIDQSHHDLVADEQGMFHLVWLDDREENGYQGLRYARSRTNGQSWESRQTVDDSTCSCCWNRLQVTKNGDINVLYRDMSPRDMAMAQSTDSGESWRQLGRVANFNWEFDGCPHNGGGLTEAGVGQLHASIWTGKEPNAGLYQSRSEDGGKTWAPPRVVGAGTNAFHSDIAAKDGDRLAVIWDAMGPDGSTVKISKSMDAGDSWSEPNQVSNPGISASYPRIIATDNGWYAIWYEQKSKEGKKLYSAIIH